MIPNHSKTISTLTLGCKVNDIDTQAMLEQFSAHGYTINPDFNTHADVYLINTCTITNVGDKKSRQMIRRAKEQNPNAIVIAAGCYSQAAPEEVAAVKGVDIILGNKDRINVANLVAQYQASGQTEPYVHVSDLRYETIFEEMQITSMGGKTRAFLKIQEGCNEFCSYCIIPYSRGNSRSRPLANIVAEAQELVKNGYKELVLSGIHLASYGKDLASIPEQEATRVDKETNVQSIFLADVIKAIHDIPGLERIRLGSIEPMVTTPYFIETIQTLPKVCDHFHLSLQSGSDKILRAMNRKYTREEFRQSVASIRAIMPHAAITTDIIVGFPGESNLDFLETLDFAREIGFAAIHIFPYASKKGTRAAKFGDQIDNATKNMRAQTLGELDKQGRADFAHQSMGKPLAVLFESTDGAGSYEGYSSNYIKVTTTSPTDLRNHIAAVTITQTLEESAFGDLLIPVHVAVQTPEKVAI